MAVETKRPMKSPRGRDTRTLILDVAERLFAERGYFGVSVRDITQECGTRLASVNYYFESKEALLKQVILRRSAEVNEERRVRLELLMDIGGSRYEMIERIVDAFTRPLFDRAIESGDGWDDYVRLIAQINSQRFWASTLMAPYFDSIAVKFCDALRTISPSSTEYAVLLAYQFMAGTILSVLAQNGRIDVLSNGTYSSKDLHDIYPDLKLFLSGGISTTLGSEKN